MVTFAGRGVAAAEARAGVEAFTDRDAGAAAGGFFPPDSPLGIPLDTLLGTARGVPWDVPWDAPLDAPLDDAPCEARTDLSGVLLGVGVGAALSAVAVALVTVVFAAAAVPVPGRRRAAVLAADAFILLPQMRTDPGAASGWRNGGNQPEPSAPICRGVIVRSGAQGTPVGRDEPDLTL